MTPIIFVTFLISLVLVDYRNSARRSQYHAEKESRWLPQWLHRLVYRYRRYQYVAVDDRSELVRDESTGRPYYHSKQRKLMKMEASEAFEMRGWVVFVLGLVIMCAGWGVWAAVVWGLRIFLR
ncbi:hypothetical protein GQ53DRAFT_752479 [Thozetella sp. PMI_491]|nr:hypothetical protein GQ53DRAFT_752479 [Thozetella sp. PMI_491]